MGASFCTKKAHGRLTLMKQSLRPVSKKPNVNSFTVSVLTAHLFNLKLLIGSTRKLQYIEWIKLITAMMLLCYFLAVSNSKLNKVVEDINVAWNNITPFIANSDIMVSDCKFQKLTL